MKLALLYLVRTLQATVTLNVCRHGQRQRHGQGQGLAALDVDLRALCGDYCRSLRFEGRR